MRYIKRVDWINSEDGNKNKFDDLIIRTNNVWTYLLLNWFMVLFLSLAIPLFGIFYRFTLRKDTYYEKIRTSKPTRNNPNKLKGGNKQW